MNSRELKKKLGMEPGETLTALVALAERESPSAPQHAFAHLWLELPWLAKGANAKAIRHATPKNVHPFAETGGDGNHFGFLLDGKRPTDERPIVFVAPRDDDEATQIVAPSLRAFLGLVAVAFGEVVSRDATDAEWASARQEWYGDDPARLAEMDRLASLLCTIPGVERPKSPSSVANACPSQRFELVDDDVKRAPAVAPGEQLARNVATARINVVRLADGLFIEGQVVTGEPLANAKRDATRALVAALDALEAVDAAAAAATVTSWRRETALWKALFKGASNELADRLARYDFEVAAVDRR